MKIGVIVAMDKEFVQLKTILDDCKAETINGKDYFIGNLLHHRLILQKCGIGKVNAAIGTVEMINGFHPDLIVSSGVAGGAAIDMNPLDVVMGTEYRYHDVYCGSEVEYGQFVGLPPSFDGRPDGKEMIIGDGFMEHLRAQSITLHKGLIVSGDWFVDDKNKMQGILDKFPKAKAVDMESCSIAQTCYLYHTPFISFRIISDVPLRDTKASQYFDFWERMAEGSFNVTKEFLLNIKD